MNENEIRIKRLRDDSTGVEGLMPRCFLTGASCANCRKIIDSKVKRHSRGEVMVFVIMYYSDMTDTVYKWLIRGLIEEVRFTFQDAPDMVPVIDETADYDRWYHSADRDMVKTIKLRFKAEENAHAARYMTLVRADDYSSCGHVICESVCAKIQEADLVVADISYDSPNVFYELGLAIALKKKIVPICYLPKYYEETDKYRYTHLRNFPWKETLFKYFAINRAEKDEPDYNKKQYHEDDEEYTKYPYTDSRQGKEGSCNPSIGHVLMKVLNESVKTIDDLLLYDLTGFKGNRFCDCERAFQNEVVNKVYEKMRQPGDRIAILYSEEEVKNEGHWEAMPTRYSFGAICKLAIDQATAEIENGEEGGAYHNQDEKFLLQYINNRTADVSLEYPVYVRNLKQRMFRELRVLTDDDQADEERENSCFTYLDVVLANVSNSHMAFVDLRKNLPQTFFWMGVLQGSGRFTVLMKFRGSRDDEASEPRIAIDVAGLWNAYYMDYNSREFKRRIRLVLDDIYEKRGHLRYWQKRWVLEAARQSGKNPDSKNPYDTKGKKYQEMELEMEQFYQRKFWMTLLERSDIDIYPTPVDTEDANYISNWEYNGFVYINNYINRLALIHKADFKNSLKYWDELRRELAQEGKNILDVTFHPGRSSIAMGDRTVSFASAGIMKPYRRHLFMLNKCDCCRKKDGTPYHYADCYYQGEDGSCRNEKVCKCLQGDGKKSFRGFSFGKKTIYGPFLSRDDLSRLTDSLSEKQLTVYGHLVIVRETADGRWGEVGMKGGYITVVLEGSTGPGTFALAKILSSDEGKRDGNASMLFFRLQSMMLAYYKKDLENRFRSEGDEAAGTFLESVKTYLIGSLCNSFLPVILPDFLEAMKKRAWSFIHVSGRREGSFFEDSTLDSYYRIAERWIDWIDGHRFLEAIVKVDINSSYYIDKSKDLRELRSISLLEDTVFTYDSQIMNRINVHKEVE